MERSAQELYWLKKFIPLKKNEDHLLGYSKTNKFIKIKSKRGLLIWKAKSFSKQNIEILHLA